MGGQLRIELVELAHLALRAPQGVAGAGVAQIGQAAVLDALVEIEAARPLVGQRLVVHEAVVVGRADGLLIEAHRLELAPLDTGDLRADQGGAIGEILGAVGRPGRQLLMMDAQGREKPPALFAGAAA